MNRTKSNGDNDTSSTGRPQKRQKDGSRPTPQLRVDMYLLAVEHFQKLRRRYAAGVSALDTIRDDLVEHSKSFEERMKTAGRDHKAALAEETIAMNLHAQAPSAAEDVMASTQATLRVRKAQRSVEEAKRAMDEIREGAHLVPAELRKLASRRADLVKAIAEIDVALQKESTYARIERLPVLGLSLPTPPSLGTRPPAAQTDPSPIPLSLPAGPNQSTPPSAVDSPSPDLPRIHPSESSRPKTTNGNSARPRRRPAEASPGSPADSSPVAYWSSSPAQGTQTQLGSGVEDEGDGDDSHADDDPRDEDHTEYQDVDGEDVEEDEDDKEDEEEEEEDYEEEEDDEEEGDDEDETGDDEETGDKEETGDEGLPATQVDPDSVYLVSDPDFIDLVADDDDLSIDEDDVSTVGDSASSSGDL